MEAIQTYGYMFETPGSELVKTPFTIDSLDPADVVVEIAGCGLCHTDLAFFTGEVKPKQMPVILGHEISGTVVAAGGSHQQLLNKKVIVPAVLPCGDCDLCSAGRGNICRSQKMPGNDFHGGFAKHIVVPGRFLCVVPDDTAPLELSQLSVIADAVTTPYQALVRSGLEQDDLAIVVGVGGIGIHMVQHAAGAGARVIAVDVDAGKLESARMMGADFAIDASLPDVNVKKAVRALVKEHALPTNRWKVFETSGSAAGQKTAFSLLSFAGTLAIVGFTMDTVDVRLSNAMAFDAEIFGNWACKPEHYPAVLDGVLSGRVNLLDNIEEHPLDTINAVIPLALEHKFEKRVIFTP